MYLTRSIFLVIFSLSLFLLVCNRPVHSEPFLNNDDQAHLYGTIAFSGAVFQVWNPSNKPVNKIDPLIPFLSGVVLEIFVQKIDHPSYIDTIHLLCGINGSLLGTTGCCLIRIIEQ